MAPNAAKIGAFKEGESMKTLYALIGGVFTGAIWMLIAVSNSESHPRDNCECQELRAIRRILEQQFQVVCDDRRCLPLPTPTAPNGGPLE